jgi:uncharacterized protein involved in outer membrane biogenesis
MRVSIRKLGLAVLAIFIVLPVVVYWLADTWLESSGGRQMLEQTLTGRFGMRVRLEGEFELMLLPAIGVSGTELVIGGMDAGTEFARSREYEISVALQPLLDRKVLLEWVRMTGGRIYPERYTQSGSIGEGKKGAGLNTVGTASTANFLLSEIREISIRDFQIVLPGEDEFPLPVKKLTISGFAENRDTPFALEIENLAAVDGRLRWDPSRSLLQFGNLRLDLGGQLVGGQGCLFLQTPRSLHLDLQASAFDLDAFRESLPDTGQGSGEVSGGLPLMIRARFSADELRSSGAVARGVVFSLGDEPACD